MVYGLVASTSSPAQLRTRLCFPKGSAGCGSSAWGPPQSGSSSCPEGTTVARVTDHQAIAVPPPHPARGLIRRLARVPLKRDRDPSQEPRNSVLVGSACNGSSEREERGRRDYARACEAAALSSWQPRQSANRAPDQACEPSHSSAVSKRRRTRYAGRQVAAPHST